LELSKRIPRRRKISAKELHDQLSQADFKRTIRTVERQLKTLCDHFPIECDDREKPYGYRWFDDAEGFSLPALNEQESMILMLAEEHLKSLLPNSVLKSMAGFFTQAKTNLMQQSDKKLEKQWLNKVRVISQTQPLLPAAI